MSDTTAASLAIRDEVFLPALREAVSQAMRRGATGEVLLNASTNAFALMLVEILGRGDAAKALRGLADHIDAQGLTGSS
jgi:hypothetical protein